MELIYSAPIESKDFPGYYEIPNFSRYVISPQGVMISKVFGHVLKVRHDASGYLSISLTRDTKKEPLPVKHGRIMLLAFKYPGDIYSCLEVNHINGTKDDDSIENLEWCTRQENMTHASENGLHPTPQPVSMRDIDTGEVKHFPTKIECARYIGVSRDAMDYRLMWGQERLFPERKQYRMGNTDEPWYIPDNIEMELLKHNSVKRAQVRHVLTGEMYEFDRMIDLAKHLNIAPSTLSVWMGYPDQPLLPGYVQIKWSHDPSPWRDVEDPETEIMYTNRAARYVKARCAATGEETIYPAVSECAKAHNLLKTTLIWRLKTPDDKVYPDGYQYMYITPEHTKRDKSSSLLSYQTVMSG